MTPRFFKPIQLMKINWAGLFAFLLLSLLAIILVLIVLVQHKVRHLETSYYQGLQTQAKLDEEWGRLMLEKSHLSSPARVERVARDTLQMTVPQNQQVIILQSREP